MKPRFQPPLPESIDGEMLPNAVDAERYLLGTLMIEPDAMPVVEAVLTRDDLFLEKHRIIFDRIKDLIDRGERVADRVSLANELVKHGELQSVDGLSYLVSLDDGLPRIYNLGSYAQIIREKSVLRKAIIAADEFKRRCFTGVSSQDLLVDAERLHMMVAESGTRQVAVKTPLQIQEECGGYDRFFAPISATDLTVPLENINRTMMGLQPGKYIILAATPSTGKSALMFQIAIHILSTSQKRVLIVTLETVGKNLMHRAIVSRAKVSGYKFKYGELDSYEWDRVQDAWIDIAGFDTRLLTCDSSSTTIESLTSLLRTLKSQGMLPDVVFVDYLQILQVMGRYENRVQEVSKISRGLQAISHDFMIPVVALSQLKRPTDALNWEPRISDLRESGQLEQDADVALFLWKLDSDLPRATPETEVVRWAIKKNRDGMLNRGELIFHKQHLYFQEAA